MIRPRYAPYVEISLDNVLHNISQIRAKLPNNVGVIAVVKDCSYGCGSALVAKTLEDEGGVNFFAVARPQEAIYLRNSGLESPVLVLGMATEEELRFGAKNKILFALNDLSEIDRWKSYRINVDYHVNIDTGMSRMGILPSEVGQLIDIIKNNADDAKGLRLDGVFTHMACADEPGTSSVSLQSERFKSCADAIRAALPYPIRVHYENSAAAIRFPVDMGIAGINTTGTGDMVSCAGGAEPRPYKASSQSGIVGIDTDHIMVRPGVTLYGCKPDPAQDFNIDLKPILSLKSSVAKMKKVPAGTPVSYCWNYRTTAETWIATVPLGYAHGLPRFLSGKGSALIGGKRYPIAGNVTMDYIMIDAGANPTVSVGDEVVAIGTQGNETITPDDVALLGGTIGYEIICNIGTAIDRYYLRNGEVVHHDPGVIF